MPNSFLPGLLGAWREKLNKMTADLVAAIPFLLRVNLHGWTVN
jgi:hypothetical protein